MNFMNYNLYVNKAMMPQILAEDTCVPELRDFGFSAKPKPATRKFRHCQKKVHREWYKFHNTAQICEG